MRRFCDLHTHSLASDGTVSPAELIAMADRKRLAGVALTDHDTLAGLAEAARAAQQFPSLRFVPGIEVSASFPHGTLHILGLCFDPASPGLAHLAAELRGAREERNPKMIAKLQGLGVEVTLDELVAETARKAGPASPSQRVVGRAHLATLLVRKGYARSIPDAFARYLGVGAPAYVDKERLTPAQVIAGIHSGAGLAMLAHPVQLKYENFAQCERIVRSLMHAGLDGIEVYHSDHSDLETRFFLDLARRLNLAVSGGSDFHGSVKEDVRLGNPRVPADIMEALLARAAGKR